MKFTRAIGFCRCCREDVVILRRVPSHGLHLVLSCLTAGLWAALWLRAARRSRAWHCSQCGRVVLNGAITPLPAQAAEPPAGPAGRRLDSGRPPALGNFNHKLVFQGLVYYLPTGSLLH
ncbi:MAG: hypothetical protein R6X05_11290 [Desulfobacterales bacterium]|jgi:hypothetical protein